MCFSFLHGSLMIDVENICFLHVSLRIDVDTKFVSPIVNICILRSLYYLEIFYYFTWKFRKIIMKWRGSNADFKFS